MDGQFPAPSIDQDRQADPGRSTEVADRIHGRSDGPARVQDIVDEDHLGIVDLERHVGPSEDRPVTLKTNVVSIEGNVDGTNGRVLSNQPGQAFGDRNSPGPHADKAKSSPRHSPVRDLPGKANEQFRHNLGTAELGFGS